ncbi:TadE/TadG family type IV pilus assembly protein [Aurantiacibacter sp. MUD61]|uniref:TadE/TadG family type IV pilus assembly protein n=1 Tax=Aurantiacibacter sp. MUD61 TaxID=3009083 RepID=UPI0022F00D3D|nr:TadE/TadG family type IV pilus assembly protein [Aurantiacibacter sp. MUD61]
MRSAFIRDESGAIAATYAIAITGLIIVAGAAFDYNRVMALDSELQSAADQAALAGVTQLDEADGACARAGNAAVSLVSGISLMSNDGDGNTITVNSGDTITVTEDACASFTGIVFYEDEDRSRIATTDEDAKFIQVSVDQRAARYAFTSIGSLFANDAGGTAMAGLGSAVCEVPPLMVCNPSPGTTLSTRVGWGIQATGHGNTRDGGTNGGGTGGTTVSTWAPGDFGFLEVGAGQNSDLLRALAFDEVPLDCAPAGGTVPETGNPQSLYDAVNTRFDVFDFSAGAGTPLAPCFSGNCPSATNVVKDLAYSAPSGQGQGGGAGPACGFANGVGQSGWRLPPEANRFRPKASGSIPNPATVQSHDGLLSDITAMGHPRDLCHYTSFGLQCGNDPNNRFGNGTWARYDYFQRNHGTLPPATNITRYETYLWELGLKTYPGFAGSLPNTGGNGQRGAPICTPSYGGVPDANRRVLQIAVVDNCSELQGASTAVDIGEWIEVFLVEPTIDGRGNGALRDSIYVEIIGPASLGSGSGVGNTLQSFRRDKAYLVE